MVNTAGALTKPLPLEVDIAKPTGGVIVIKSAAGCNLVADNVKLCTIDGAFKTTLGNEILSTEAMIVGTGAAVVKLISLP